MQIFKITGFFLLNILILASCSKKKHESTAGQTGAAPVPSVQVMIVEPSLLENKIIATGTLLANESIELRSETQGRIVQILFEEGQKVEKGKLLVKIDDSELQAQMQRTILSIQLAKDDEIRKNTLYKAGGISKEEYDIAQNTYLKLETEKQLIEAQIAKTSIYAPFSGVLGLRFVSEGSFISPTNIISTLQQTNPLKLEFTIPEKYGLTIKSNIEVTFTVEGQSSIYFAKVYAKEPKIDPATRTVTVRATCANTQGNLLPGAFAKVHITLEMVDNALTVPSQTIIPGITGQSVFIIKNGKAALMPVVTGIRTETHTQILEGIQQGDSIIITGLLTVRNGMPVKGILN